MRRIRCFIPAVIIIMFMGIGLSAQRGQRIPRPRPGVGDNPDPHGAKALKLANRQEHKYRALRYYYYREDKTQDFGSFMENYNMAMCIPPEERSYEACQEGARKHILRKLRSLYHWTIWHVFNDAKKRTGWVENLDDLSKHLNRYSKEGNNILEMCKIAGLDYKELFEEALTEEHRKESAAMLEQIKSAGEQGEDLLFSVGAFLLCPHPEKNVSELIEWLRENHDKDTFRLAMLYIAKDPIATALMDELKQADDTAPPLHKIDGAKAFVTYLSSNPPEKEQALLLQDLLQQQPRWLYELGLNSKLPMDIRESIVKSILENRERKLYPKYLSLPSNKNNNVLKKLMLEHFSERGYADFDLLFDLAFRRSEDASVRRLAMNTLVKCLTEQKEELDDENWSSDKEDLAEYTNGMNRLSEALTKLSGNTAEPGAVRDAAKESLASLRKLRAGGEPTLVALRKRELMKARKEVKESLDLLKRIKKPNRSLTPGELRDLEIFPGAMAAAEEMKLAEAELNLFYAEITEIARQHNGKLPQKLEGLRLSFDLYKKPLYFPTEKLEQLSEDIVFAAFPKNFVVKLPNNKTRTSIIFLDGQGEFQILSDEDRLKKILTWDAEQRKELGLNPINYDVLLKLLNK